MRWTILIDLMNNDPRLGFPFASSRSSVDLGLGVILDKKTLGLVSDPSLRISNGFSRVAKLPCM